MNGERQQLEPAIHRVPLDQLTIYEVTEAELDELERGSPNSLFLNLSIGVLSIAISFSISLATASITSIKTFCVFVIVTVIGYLGGIAFLLLWWLSRQSSLTVAQRIRNRRTPEGIQDEPIMIEHGGEGMPQ